MPESRQIPEKETPLVFPLGWIILSIGIVPLIGGIKESKLTMAVTGGVLIASGIVLLIIGLIVSASRKGKQ
jgi:hypothetical protein